MRPTSFRRGRRAFRRSGRMTATCWTPRGISTSRARALNAYFPNRRFFYERTGHFRQPSQEMPATSTKPTGPAELTDEEELYWLALRMVPGLGTRRVGLLLERLRTPQAIFRASASELEGAGLNGTLARSVAGGVSFEAAAQQQEKVRKAGAKVILIADARYPESLRKIFDPPPLLFARGRLELLRSICLGVVGTRHPTPYGLAATEKLAGDLARAGLTITSGLARGIDTAAHKAALAAEGQTIAVLGCGVDVVYPSENKRLAAEIVEKGLVVSEFPMESVAFPQNFPVRNRVISGLSAGILVVEGAQYSGSGLLARPHSGPGPGG